MRKLKLLVGIALVVLITLICPVFGCPTFPTHETDFSYAPSDPLIDETVAFTDETTWKWISQFAGKSWEWDFGDGSATSALQHPTHTYITAGTYTVTLTTTNVNPGGSQTSVKDCEKQIVVTYPLYGDGEDDPSANLNNKDANWNILDDGRYGKLYTDYLIEKFYFEAFGMEPDTDYSLIYYPDPWGCTVTIMGTGTSSTDGFVTIAGAFDLDLSENKNGDGYKIWLVKTCDLTGSTLNKYNPSEWLFESVFFGIETGEPALIVPTDEFVPDESSHTPATYGANLGDLVYLSKKSQDGSVWNAVDFEECGVMEVDESSYWVMASRLDPNEKYTLIYYPDPYLSPKEVAVLGSGTPNKWGRMTFGGEFNFAETIDVTDYNLHADTTTYNGELTGVKFWLVPEDAVSGDILNWNDNAKFLFEAELYLYTLPEPEPEGEDDPSANLNNKNPDDWEEVYDKDGRYGKLYTDYTVKKFYFEAFGMDDETEYSLIYYPDPWGCEVTVIGTAESDSNGNIVMDGSFNIDKNVLKSNKNVDGYKIWLVKSSDLAENYFTEWNPSEYLFETELFGINDNGKPKKIVPKNEFVPDKACHTPATYSSELGTKVYLCQKTSECGVWEPVDFTACGRMEISENTYWVKASRLFDAEKYVLIYYPDPWTDPKTVAVIGEGSPDKWGRMKFSGEFNLGEIIDKTDYNLDEELTTYENGVTGIKFWLVPDDAVSGGILSWNANEEFLFESKLYEYSVPEPVVEFSYEQSLENTLEFKFYDDSTDLPEGVLEYAWDFDDGECSPDCEPLHQYAVPGIYTVSLTISQGGIVIGTATHDCTIHAIDFTYEVEDDLKVTFHEQCIGFDDGVSFIWSIDDGDVVLNGTDPEHIFEKGGAHTVKMTVYVGETYYDEVTKTIELKVISDGSDGSSYMWRPYPPLDGGNYEVLPHLYAGCTFVTVEVDTAAIMNDIMVTYEGGGQWSLGGNVSDDYCERPITIADNEFQHRASWGATASTLYFKPTGQFRLQAYKKYDDGEEVDIKIWGGNTPFGKTYLLWEGTSTDQLTDLRFDCDEPFTINERIAWLNSI